MNHWWFINLNGFMNLMVSWILGDPIIFRDSCIPVDSWIFRDILIFRNIWVYGFEIRITHRWRFIWMNLNERFMVPNTTSYHDAFWRNLTNWKLRQVWNLYLKKRLLRKGIPPRGTHMYCISFCIPAWGTISNIFINLVALSKSKSFPILPQHCYCLQRVKH